MSSINGRLKAVMQRARNMRGEKAGGRRVNAIRSAQDAFLGLKDSDPERAIAELTAALNKIEKDFPSL